MSMTDYSGDSDRSINGYFLLNVFSSSSRIFDLVWDFLFMERLLNPDIGRGGSGQFGGFGILFESRRSGCDVSLDPEGGLNFFFMPNWQAFLINVIKGYFHENKI